MAPGKVTTEMDATAPSLRSTNETAKRRRTPKYADKKGVNTYLPDEKAEALAAIALTQNLGMTKYIAQFLKAHIEANPNLIEAGKVKQAAGERVPYRTRRAELEVESRRLREELRR